MADDDRYDGEDLGDDYEKQEPPRRKEVTYGETNRMLVCVLLSFACCCLCFIIIIRETHVLNRKI